MNNENEKIIDIVVKRNDVLKNHKKWDVLLDFLSKENTKRMIWKKVLNPKITMIFGESDEGHYYNRKNVKNYDFDCTPPVETHIIDYLICFFLFYIFILSRFYVIMILNKKRF